MLLERGGGVWRRIYRVDVRLRVYEPDLLLQPTTICSSVWCANIGR
jgi:hypothetical protein